MSRNWMPLPVSLSSRNSPYFLPIDNWLPDPFAVDVLGNPCVLTLGSPREPPPLEPLSLVIQDFFFSPRAMLVVLLVAACCWASVAFASAWRFCSFLFGGFLVSTSGARSPSRPSAGVPRVADPVVPTSPGNDSAAVRRVRLVSLSCSALRSSCADLWRASATRFGKAIVVVGL